jgi:Spy/CpxP family protein refolding chaperone
MNIKICLTLLTLCLSVIGFSQEADDRANAAVQEEMKMYHKELNLSGEQLYKITQLLGDKIKKNEIVLAEIEALKKKLDHIDVSTDKQILSVLNEDQRVIMQEKLEEKLAKQQEDFKASVTD